MILNLINIGVLLLALCLLQGYIVRQFKGDETRQQLVSGMLYAGACLFAMSIPIEIGAAATADARFLLLCLGAYFGGPLVAVLSSALVSAYLVTLGGGQLADVLGLLLAAFWGLGFRYLADRRRLEPGFLGLLLLGFAAHAGAAILSAQFAPDPASAAWDRADTVILTLAAFATALLGMLLADIERRSSAEAKLIENQALLSHHLENTPLAAISWDDQFRCTQWNKAAEKIFGYSSAEALGKHGTELLIPDYLQAEIDQQFAELVRTASASQKINENKTRDGRIIVCEWYNTPIYDKQGNTIGIASLGEDITAKREAEELIWKQANYDSLTGLANRKLLQDRLEQEIKKADRSEQSVALLYMDLDQFKDINDSLGHHVGDKLLQEAASRLTGYIREIDTVARLGGDEFIIVMGGLEHFGDVERVAGGLLEQLAQPFDLDHETVYVSASIGITFYPQDARQIDQLLKNADQAMYAAKNLGRNCFQYFTPSMQHEVVARMSMVKDLHTALPKNQFELYFQPIVDLASGEICKGEALLRWSHPEHGLVTPDRFIAHAEETRLINDIGDWAFRQALKHVRRWRESYDPEFQVCVNASPVQFASRQGHVDSWVDCLHEENLPGNAVAIEITENLLMQNVGKFTKNLYMFRDAGIQVSLDDFGTGYSSLSYLKRFDIDYLKIDRSFVQNLDRDPDDVVLCHAIIAMAHKLGLRVVAEGIETRQQRVLLEAAGCDFGQGFVFSEALPVAEFEQLLTEISKAS